jgi:hypothetical protein
MVAVAIVLLTPSGFVNPPDWLISTVWGTGMTFINVVFEIEL